MRSPSFRRRSAGFTLIEVMIVLMIMSIITLIAMDAIASFEANQRADRAAREALACFRFTRNLAMTTGKKAKVVVDTSARTLSVYWQSNGSTYDATPYTTGLTSTGSWVLNLNNSRELIGTTLSTTNTTAGYTNYFEFSPLGSCTPYIGTLNFSYASKTKGLVVASVGDPQIQ